METQTLELDYIYRAMTLMNFNKEGQPFVNILETFIQYEFDSKFKYIDFLAALHKLVEDEKLTSYDVYIIGVIVYTLKSECKGSVLLDSYISCYECLFDETFNYTYNLVNTSRFIDGLFRTSKYKEVWCSYNFLQTPILNS